MRRHFIIACACLGLVGAAPASPDGTSPDVTSPEVTSPDGATVTIDNFSFGPAEIVVPVGGTVTWINRDDIPHTVTGADAPQLFRSPPLDTDERFAHRFDRAGRYAYFCSLHAHMQGVVVVR